MNNNPFLDRPEIKHHFEAVLPIIVEESDRGAVLIAQSQVDKLLEEALKKVAPKDLSNNKLKDIFNFSGPLGTFSAKVNMAYFFRIIHKEVFSAMHALRKLRNAVAHKPESFSLKDHSDTIEKYYNIGPNFPTAVNKWALEVMAHTHIRRLLDLRDSEAEDDKPFFTDPKEVIEYIRKNEEIMGILESVLPRWKIGLGTALICGVFLHWADNARSLLGDNSIISNLNINSKKD